LNVHQPSILEVIVCSQADALAAADGGANRLEVISHYEAGGLTPPIELVRRIVATVRLPLRVMVRQSESFVVHQPAEIEELCAAARAFADIPVDGLVLGFLRENPAGKRIDHQLLKRVLTCAPNVKATFHRAFEDLRDPLAAIAELKQHPQIDRILTSGGRAPTSKGAPSSKGASSSKVAWPGKLERLTAWQQAASPEIQLVIGGGTDAEVIRRLKPTLIREFHVGIAVREGRRIDGPVLAERVRALAAIVR
jgi:copper homeostasis protein